MNILHISNGYADSKVHSNLTRALDNYDIKQTVYCPVREERLLGKNQFDGKHVKFIYSNCIKSWYKYVYHYKMWKLFGNLRTSVNIGQYDIILAPTLFSDGGLALMAYKKYGTPYIVAVRNTDINLYMKRLKHTHKMGREILLNANKIIFISKGEMKEFAESQFAHSIYDQIVGKIVLQPNGIDDFWLNNISFEQRNGHNVLYVGDYSPNKNVVRLAEAIIQLRKESGYGDVRLIVVGGEKKGKAWKTDNSTQEVISKNPDAIKAMGWIYDKERLLQIMRECAIFAMPSILETFGLVYIEALSQNLPVLYSMGQGIDGLFDDSVGISVNPLSVEDIRNAIKTMFTSYNQYNNKNVNFECFKWSVVAKNYLNFFNDIN